MIKTLFAVILILSVAACGHIDPRRLNADISVPTSTIGNNWFHAFNVSTAPSATESGLRRRDVVNLVGRMIETGLRQQRFSAQVFNHTTGSFNVNVDSFSYSKNDGSAQAVITIRSNRANFVKIYNFSAPPSSNSRSVETRDLQIGLVLRSIITEIVTDQEFLSTLDRSLEATTTTQPQLRNCAEGERPQWRWVNMHIAHEEPRYVLSCNGPNAPPRPNHR